MASAKGEEESLSGDSLPLELELREYRSKAFGKDRMVDGAKALIS